MDGMMTLTAEPVDETPADRIPELLERIHNHPVVRRGRAREFRALVAATFVFMLFGLALARMIPGRRPSEPNRLPLVREAWAKANACIGFAFQCL